MQSQRLVFLLEMAVFYRQHRYLRNQVSTWLFNGKGKMGEVQEKIMPAFNSTVVSISAPESKIHLLRLKLGRVFLVVKKLLVRKLMTLLSMALPNMLNPALGEI